MSVYLPWRVGAEMMISRDDGLLCVCVCVRMGGRVRVTLNHRIQQMETQNGQLHAWPGHFKNCLDYSPVVYHVKLSQA